MSLHVTKIDRDELIKHIFDELVERNRESENHPDGYDVDAFYTDIVNVKWDKLFVIDDEFIVDFNCAVIEFIISDARTDKIVGCDTVKVWFKEFVWK
jgi:hypothetical protein